LAATTCDPVASGVFTKKLITPSGCDSIVITTVDLLPSNTTAVPATTCDPAQAGVFVYNLKNKWGCDSIVTKTVQLLPTDTTVLSFTTCDPTQVGTVPVKLKNKWGCDSTILRVTSLLPPNSCGVNAVLTGSTIPCGSNTGNLTLTATLGEAPFDYTVKQGTTTVKTGNFNALNASQTIGGLPGGTYTVVLSSPNGFTTTAQATIIQLVPPTLSTDVVSNYAGFSVSCPAANDGSAKAIPAGGVLPYTYQWSNGGNTQQINNLGAGIYTVLVTDKNNCTVSSEVSLTEPTPLKVAFTVSDLDCFGDKDGAIAIITDGGAPPYRYTLNDGPQQTSNLFTGLNAGVYSITAYDQNDCEQDEAIVVNAVIPIDVELGNDQTILLGDSTKITALVNYPLDSILTVEWTPPLGPDECPDPENCLTRIVKPLISTTYAVKIEGINGCVDEDKLRILVDRRKHIYVPNVISPDGDGINDILNIFAKPGLVANIKSMLIFDRWGETLYTLYNFLPNNPTQGWDGNFRGKPLPPGVYVWFAEIEFIDGVTELYKGDVTIGALALTLKGSI
jgi:gliding motility-associated-like protein